MIHILPLGGSKRDVAPSGFLHSRFGALSGKYGILILERREGEPLAGANHAGGGDRMEEDILGPRQTLGRRYTTCTRCGQVIPRRAAHIQEAGLLEGTHSAVADLCPD